MNLPRRGAVSGFSLIEVLIVVVIIGILLALALPAFSRWIADTRLRNQAGYVMSGLQLAKGEALKRNAVIRFQLVSDLTNACAVTANSNLWLVSHGDPGADPANSCNLVADIAATDTTANEPYGTPPVLLMKGVTEQQTTAQTVITATAPGIATAFMDPIVCFSGTGRLARVANVNMTSNTGVAVAVGQCVASMNPGTTSAPSITIDFNDPATQDGNSATTGRGLCFDDSAAPAGGFHASGTVRCQRVLVSPSGEIRMCDPGLSAAKHPGDPRVCS
jgi:type IV fimbrial biogenesis protein FimT